MTKKVNMTIERPNLQAPWKALAEIGLQWYSEDCQLVFKWSCRMDLHVWSMSVCKCFQFFPVILHSPMVEGVFWMVPATASLAANHPPVGRRYRRKPRPQASLEVSGVSEECGERDFTVCCLWSMGTLQTMCGVSLLA
jgi:hypothetical protein